MSGDTVSVDMEVDETKLGGENGDLYLFQWLASNEKALGSIPMDELKKQQTAFESVLIKVITAGTPYPPPGRPIRNLVVQCFTILYSRGETRSLFDTLQAFIRTCGEQKPALPETNRVAALYCIGELMKEFGPQVMSLVADSAAVCIRLNRTSNTVMQRYHALTALEKLLSSTKRAFTDSLLKDTLKQAKQALADKALPIVRVGAKILTSMYPSGDGSRTAAEIESIVTICVKQLDAADQPTCATLAAFAAHILSSSQIERKLPVVEQPKKNKKGDENAEEEEEAPPPGSTLNEEVKLIMTPTEMFAQLSNHFNKPQASHKARIGLFSFYSALISNLGSTFVERNYGLIVAHFMSEVISHPRSMSSRHEKLVVRTLVGIVLRQLIGVRMLSEQAQIFAIQELSNSYLKRWPAMMPGQTAPNSAVLTIALREVAGLLQQLGNAPGHIQDSLLDPLVALLSHPNHTVRVHGAWTLRCFCFSTPLRLPKQLLSIVEMLQHDLSALASPVAPANVVEKALGHAYGLSSLIALIPSRPLYISYDVNSDVFFTSVQLLKRAGEHDVQVAKVEIEVAWTIIASLMTSGPNFVRAHLPQLLVLWRNSLPKPTSKENTTDRPATEWLFLLRVRENALRAVYSFLKHNGSSLVTTDITRRLTSLLSNALQFANIFLSQRFDILTDPTSETSVDGPLLHSAEALLRCRIFQCFDLLDLTVLTETTQISLVQSAVSLFASPEGYYGSAVQAAIASSSGSFMNIWQSTDGYAYGLNNIDMREDRMDGSKDWLNRDAIDAAIDNLIGVPIIQSFEHDPIGLCQEQPPTTKTSWQESPAAPTAVVNAAIQLFASMLSTLDASSVSRSIAKLIETANSPKLDKNPGRKAAVLINSTVALALAFRSPIYASRTFSEVFNSSQSPSLVASFMKNMITNSDEVLRRTASEVTGRLAKISGTTFLTSQIKTLVNEVVANRDPHGRAGCALAFGAIYDHVGGLAAGPLLKTTVHVLMSLINDPHPVVHFWSLKSLSQVINAASLAYATFVPSTLGLLFRVYMMESHEPEGGSINYVNLSGALPAYQAICQCIDAVITVVGPDIQESDRTRSLLLDLVRQFVREDDDRICVEAIKGIQHFLMFAPDFVEIPVLVAQFRGYLSSTKRPLKIASINALYQLVQKDALLMSKLGGDQLVQELFALLDDESSVDGVRDVIKSWLHQTVVHNPSAWIDLCQKIMSRASTSQQTDSTGGKREVVDDEGQYLSVGAADDIASDSQSRLASRWRTQLFALQCLHDIITIVARSGRREHVDLKYASNVGTPTRGLLAHRISDLIKIAFTASATHVMEIRLEGLVVLKDIIQVFATAPDPDFEGTLLLEQYQAPITAALTPAFSTDSTPEILASAIETCATFVGSGFITDVIKMGRVLRLLTSALTQCTEPGMLHLGDSAELGPNASVMLRIATLAAWAELKIASGKQLYLTKVIQPYQGILASLWLSTLRDFGSSRVGAETFDDTSSGALDSSYGTLGRDLSLPYYSTSWPTILHAVGITLQENNSYIYASMHGEVFKTADTPPPNPSNEPRNAPVLFFYAIFGLTCEVLSMTSPETSNQEVTKSALQVLQHIVKPQLSGQVFQDFGIFEELVNLFYRLASFEHAFVQVQLLQTISSLCVTLQIISSTSIAQMHCFKLSCFILKNLVSSIWTSSFYASNSASDRVSIINDAFEAYQNICDSCNHISITDGRILGLAFYSELLQDEQATADIVGPTLQSLKKLLELSSEDSNKFEQYLHGFLSASLANVDKMRGRKGPACSQKICNNMLAIALVLTTVDSISMGSSILETYCFLISQKLVELEDISLTAAQCGRTLLAKALSGHHQLHSTISPLIASMVQAVIKVASASANTADYSAVMSEIWKSFSHLLMQYKGQELQVLSIAIPLMILALQSSQLNIHTITLTFLVSFASSAPKPFKDATDMLMESEREFLETSLKQAIGSQKHQTAEHSKPQILLKSF